MDILWAGTAHILCICKYQSMSIGFLFSNSDNLENKNQRLHISNIKSNQTDAVLTWAPLTQLHKCNRLFLPAQALDFILNCLYVLGKKKDLKKKKKRNIENLQGPRDHEVRKCDSMLHLIAASSGNAQTFSSKTPTWCCDLYDEFSKDQRVCHDKLITPKSCGSSDSLPSSFYSNHSIKIWSQQFYISV